MKKASEGLSFKVILSKSLENEREVIQKNFLNAELRIKAFADINEWHSLAQKPFIKEARIFDSKDELTRYAIEFLECPPETKLPDTFSAALEKEVFLSVSPRIYGQIYPEAQESSHLKN